MSSGFISPDWRYFNASLPDFNWLSVVHSLEHEHNQGSDRSPIERLRTHISQPFRIPVSQAWIGQMEGAMGMMSLLVFLACAIILRRWSELSFWIFRKQERRDGVLLIPNAVTSFLVLENIFGTVWIVYTIDQLRVVHGNASPVRLVAWLGLTWLPLIQGAWFAGWGTFFASPLQPGGSALDTAPPEKTTKLFPSPFRGLTAPVLNVIMVTVPLTQAVLICTLTALASIKWKTAVEQWQILDNELASLITAARSSKDLMASSQISDALRDQALAVWMSADSAMGSLEHVFWAWVASAVAFTAFYSITGGTLLVQLRREATFLRRAMISSAKSAERGANVAQGERDGNALINSAKEPGVKASFWQRNKVLKAIEKKTNSQSRSSSSRRARSGRNAKYETMKRAVLLIGIQVGCISVAAAGFSIVALGIALELRRSIRHHYFDQVYMIANLIAAYTACIFGGTIFFAITARTFEFLTDIVVAAAQGSPLAPRSRRGSQDDTVTKGSRLHQDSQRSNQALQCKKQRISAKLGLSAPFSGRARFERNSLTVPKGHLQMDDSIIAATEGSDGKPRVSFACEAATSNASKDAKTNTPARKGKWGRRGRLGIPSAERSVWQDDSIILDVHEDERCPGEFNDTGRAVTAPRGLSDSRDRSGSVGSNDTLQYRVVEDLRRGLTPPPRRPSSIRLDKRQMTADTPRGIDQALEASSSWPYQLSGVRSPDAAHTRKIGSPASPFETHGAGESEVLGDGYYDPLQAGRLSRAQSKASMGGGYDVEYMRGSAQRSASLRSCETGKGSVFDP